MPYKDPEQQAEFQRRHFQANKSVWRGRLRKRREERKAWFENEVLKGLKCTRCPEDDPACLDFHHRDPSQKESEVSKLLGHLRSKEKILAEITKCDVLCSNCHRKLHYYEQRASAGSSRPGTEQRVSLALP